MLRRYNSREHVAFIDPPYVKAGHQLYAEGSLDHEALFRVLQNWRGRWLATYDDAPEIRELAQRHRLATSKVKMRTNHGVEKQERVISRDLRWLHCERCSLVQKKLGTRLGNWLRQDRPYPRLRLQAALDARQHARRLAPRRRTIHLHRRPGAARPQARTLHRPARCPRHRLRPAPLEN